MSNSSDFDGIQFEMLENVKENCVCCKLKSIQPLKVSLLLWGQDKQCTAGIQTTEIRMNNGYYSDIEHV